MLKIFREHQELKDMQAKVKSQALEISSLYRENDQLKFKISTIGRKIKGFDHIKDNPFTLINEIESEVEREF